MGNLRNKTKKQRKNRDKHKNRLLTVENRWLPEKGVGGGMVEIGERDDKYTCHGEHWVMYRIVESLYCTPETNITLLTIPE